MHIGYENKEISIIMWPFSKNVVHYKDFDHKISKVKKKERILQI
jgi:hypothetical protein